MHKETYGGAMYDLGCYCLSLMGWLFDAAPESAQAGELSYTVYADGKEETKTVVAKQNYSLEVDQLGRCIAGGETPHVSAEFSIMHAGAMDTVLEAMKY